MSKLVDQWCGEIKDKYYHAICIRTLKEDKGCKSDDSKGYCVAATFSRESFNVLKPICEKYTNDITAHICLGKAIAFVNLDAAKDHCSSLEDEGWKYFCYADVTSKVDLKSGEELCADIPEPNLLHYCYALMASKKNDFKGDIAEIQEHCSQIDFNVLPRKSGCESWGYVSS